MLHSLRNDLLKEHKGEIQDLTDEPRYQYIANSSNNYKKKKKRRNFIN